MMEFGERDVFALPDLVLGLLHERAFRWGEHIVWINRRCPPDDDRIPTLRNGHKIPCLKVEGPENFLGNRNLVPFPHAPDFLFDYCCLHGK
jgi:hypothetical protein